MSVLQTIDLKYYGTEPNITRALDGVNYQWRTANLWPLPDLRQRQVYPASHDGRAGPPTSGNVK